MTSLLIILLNYADKFVINQATQLSVWLVLVTAAVAVYWGVEEMLAKKLKHLIIMKIFMLLSKVSGISSKLVAYDIDYLKAEIHRRPNCEKNETLLDTK